MEAVQIDLVAMASVPTFVGVAGYVIQAWRKWKAPAGTSPRPVPTFMRVC